MQRTVNKFNISEKNILPLTALGGFILAGVNTLVLVGLLIMTNQLSSRSTPTLVQLADGRSIRTEVASTLERTPKVVSSFVEQTLNMGLTWSGKLPPETIEEAKFPKPDLGIAVERRKIATSSWYASFALAEEFRVPFLEKLAQTTPQEIFSGTGTSQVIFVPRNISQPIPTEVPGEWKVQVVAILLVVTPATPTGKALPYNKVVYVRAVETPIQPTEGTALAIKIWNIRQSGLEITRIRDLTQEDLS